MSRANQVAIFLKNLATGILAPVLTLGLIAHGASISTISLLLGAYSLTVILFEFPSGVFADIYGRKPAFLFSIVLQFLSYCAFLFSQSLVLLFCAMILNGLGRAFSSGSIDALAIDEAEKGSVDIIIITTRISILESIGLAAGALLGGLVSGLGRRYEGNLLTNIAICTILFFLTLLYVPEPSRAHVSLKKHEGQKKIMVQVKSSLAYMWKKGPARPLFLLVFVMGFSLLSIETYWQPGFAQARPAQWMYGVLSFAGFACVMIGSKLAEHLLTRYKNRGFSLLLIIKALFGLGLILLYTQMFQAGFILTFMLIYVLIGSGSVAENALLNRVVPSSQRASVLSLFSFVVQIGGLLASATGFFVSSLLGFRIMWLISGIITAVIVSVYVLFYRGRNRNLADD